MFTFLNLFFQNPRWLEQHIHSQSIHNYFSHLWSSWQEGCWQISIHKCMLRRDSVSGLVVLIALKYIFLSTWSTKGFITSTSHLIIFPGNSTSNGYKLRLTLRKIFARRAVKHQRKAAHRKVGSSSLVVFRSQLNSHG